MDLIIIGNNRPKVGVETTYTLIRKNFAYLPVNTLKIEWVLYWGNIKLSKKEIGSYIFGNIAIGRTYILKAIFEDPDTKQTNVAEFIITPIPADPQIVRVWWEDCNFEEIKKPVGYLDTIYLMIQTKNIPAGDKLDLTLYENEKLDGDGHGFASRGFKLPQVTVQKNGKAEIILSSELIQRYRARLNMIDGFFMSDKEHEYYIRIKYSNKIDSIQDKTQIKVKNKLEQLVTPKNGRKPVMVATASVTPPPSLIKPIRAKVDVKYDVCNDTVDNFNDYKNFYVLEEKGEGVDFHWLENRANHTITIADNYLKPVFIPVTIPSTEKIKIFITVQSFTDYSVKIRLKDTQNNYIFPNEYTNRGEGIIKDLEFESNNIPFDRTVRYFPFYYFYMEYSIDGGITWKSSGNFINLCLYITRKRIEDLLSVGNQLTDFLSKSSVRNPGSQYYSIATTPDKINVLTNNQTGRESILETLLYIGCSKADKESVDQNIVDKVFDYIAKLDTPRHRISGSMTYWKKGGPSGIPDSMTFRGVRHLLKFGEARCGEWTNFFQDICKLQGVTGLNNFSFEADNRTDANGYTNYLFLVKSWNIADTQRNKLKAPVNLGGKAQNTSNEPFNLFWDHVFATYNNRYYDPSYGIKSTTQFYDDKLLLKAYAARALSGVVSAKQNNAGEAIHDHLHSRQYINPSIWYHNIATPTNTDKYEYKIITTNMQNVLEKT